MYHENLDDTQDNVFIKFNVTPEEQRVVRKAAKAYKVHQFKNRIIRDGSKPWSSEQYLEKYPNHFRGHGKNKLKSKGKVPSDILDAYCKKKKMPLDCKRWYELARCVIAIGENK